MKSPTPIRIEGMHTASLAGPSLQFQSGHAAILHPPKSRRSRQQGWLARLTHPTTCTSIVGISLALLAYSGFTSARLTRPHPQPTRDMADLALAGGRAPESSVLESLRRDAAKAQNRILSRRFELRSVLESVELAATRKGWQVDLTLPPPIAAPQGWTNLVGYPASLHLTPAHPGASPSFASILEWLDEIARLPKHVEIAQLTIDRTSAHPLTVRAALIVLAQPENAETPPE